MSRRVRLNLWLLSAMLVTATAAPTLAQESLPITVADAYSYTFGQQITFDVDVSSPTPVTALYLYLQTEGVAYGVPHPVPITPGTDVHTSLQRDLHQHPLPPFAHVQWWWEVRGDGGALLTTEPQSFQYVDNRFEWHTTSTEHLFLHTVVDDPVYVQAAVEIGETALARIAQALQTAPVSGIDVYVYPATADLRAALEMTGRDWAGGQARPELGTVLVAAPPDSSARTRMERDIPHELTHLLVYQVTGPEGYPYVPAWLNEGLATANELRPDPELEVVLESARAQGQLVPLSDLCPPFPNSRDTALLYYAQSGSIVRYVREQYGNSGIRALLTTYADGAGCESGVTRALDVTPQQLELAWRAHLVGLSSWMSWTVDNVPLLAVWGISLLLAVPMVGLGQRRRREKKKEEE